MLHMCKAADLTNESMYEGPALERAMWRYEALWLPLLVALASGPNGPKSVGNKNFARAVEEVRRINFAKGGLSVHRDECVPPMDIAWVWHCHRLSPRVYQRDIAALGDCGDVGLDDAFRFSDGEDSQSQRVRSLWEAIYVDEPFLPPYIVRCSWDEDVAARRQGISSFLGDLGRKAFKGSIDGRAIRAVASAQKTFLRQVVGEEGQVPEGGATEELCETNQWLGRAWDRYLMWLGLWKGLGESAELVPMSDINVAWHAHLSCSGVYRKDCEAILGWVLDHDTLAVEDRRNTRTRKLLQAAEGAAIADISDDEEELFVMDGGDRDDGGSADDGASSDGGTARMSGEDDVGSLGLRSAELAEMDDDEIAALLEKRRRGMNLRPTKIKWEGEYGQSPKYDLPDTRYRGEADGERGGFREKFSKGSAVFKDQDISWVLALAVMLVASSVFVSGALLMGWAFIKTMFKHGKYLVGVPAGGVLMVAGAFVFLTIPINRPLSSNARYWRDRELKETHNPLPPYLTK